MKQLHKKALEVYLELLQIHINTKTTDIVFHEKTADFYEKLFEISHKIGERYIDLDGQLRDDNLESQKQRAYDIIKNLKNEIENYVNNNSLSLGTDDLLWGLADELEDLEWTAKAFIKK